MKGKKAYAASLLCLAAVSIAGCSAGTPTEVVVPNELAIRQYQEEDGGQVTVESIASVTAVPDVAEVSLSVRTEDAEAAVCQQKNEESLSRTLEYLKSQGIEEGAIQTSGYNLSPKYKWTDDGEQITVGYEMNTQITVSGVPIETVGGVLGGAVGAGVSSIDYVKYLCSDYDAVYGEALKKAVEAAQTKAEAMGEAGGFQVLEVKSINEREENPTARYAKANAAAVEEAEALMADTSSMSVEPGELEIEAHLTVSFKIAPR